MKNNIELLKLYEQMVEPFVNDDSIYQIRKQTDENDYNAMTCVPAFVGEKYGSEKIKLMLIGRAVNGWSADWGSNASEIAEQVLSIQFSMNSIDKCPIQNEGTLDEYNFNRCSFLNLGKTVLKDLGLKSENISANLVWSNIYKVAPAISGNPNGKIQKLQRQGAIKILLKEIELFSPTHILFVTDLDWLEATWRNNKNELSFAKAMDITENLTINNGKYVKAFGIYNKIPYVVCVRPETRSIEEMSNDINYAFNSVN